MKLSDFTKYLGKEVDFKLNTGLSFKVIIKDVKSAYGNIRMLIVPVSGSGETWVEDRNLIL